jgi:hypothetical protein
MTKLPLSAEQKERAREKLHERIPFPKSWKAAFTARFSHKVNFRAPLWQMYTLSRKIRDYWPIQLTATF